MRTQFAFYKSFDDIYQDLSSKQKIEFIDTLLDVQFLRVKINDVSFKDVILKHIWNAQKHSLEKAIKGYLDSQKNEKIKEPYLGVYNPLLTPSEGICREEQEKEEEEEQGEEQEKKELDINKYEDFIFILKSKASIKSKVTATKDGKMLFKDISNKERLMNDYLAHQINKKEFAQRTTAFMEDYNDKPSQTRVAQHYDTKGNPIYGNFQ